GALARIVVVRARAHRAVPVEEAVEDEGWRPEAPDGTGVAPLVALEGALHDVRGVLRAEHVDGAAARVRPEQRGLVVRQLAVDHAQVAVPHGEGAALAVVVAGRAVRVRDAAGGWAGRDGLLRRRLAVHEPKVLQRERVLVLLPAPGVYPGEDLD